MVEKKIDIFIIIIIIINDEILTHSTSNFKVTIYFTGSLRFRTIKDSELSQKISKIKYLNLFLDLFKLIIAC